MSQVTTYGGPNTKDHCRYLGGIYTIATNVVSFHVGPTVTESANRRVSVFRLKRVFQLSLYDGCESEAIT